MLAVRLPAQAEAFADVASVSPCCLTVLDLHVALDLHLG
jgi:hypothetical protein